MAKAWRLSDPRCPDFPDDFEVVAKAVLQKTSLRANQNKFYCLELHRAGEGEAQRFRVFTHFGRTDDLSEDARSGQRQARFFGDLSTARAAYERLYREKTSAARGYREIALAATAIGSEATPGAAAGALDRGPGAEPEDARVDPDVAELVELVYEEATRSLTSRVHATITARGIETPLGVLDEAQIAAGEAALARLGAALEAGRGDLAGLSDALYSLVPSRIGRSAEEAAAAVIDTPGALADKSETLQLMRDMLRISSRPGALYQPSVGQRLAANGCEIRRLPTGSPPFEALRRRVLESQGRARRVRLRRAWEVRRPDEWADFRADLGEQRLLFHGSRAANWLGLLIRGVLPPRAAWGLGVQRTDAGWLGQGIYFAEDASVAAFYAGAATSGGQLLGVHRVALGRIKALRRLAPQLERPPEGYDSCHGVAHGPGQPSDFDDDEFAIYDARQQRLEALVEVAGAG